MCSVRSITTHHSVNIITFYFSSLSPGIVNAYIDGDKSKISKASGFFKGYTWAMEKNNTGRSEIMPLFEGE
jgi:hypothetical protein